MLEHIIKDIYDAITFAEGGAPRFELMRPHFLEDAKMISNKGGTPTVLSVDGFIDMVSRNVANGDIVSVRESEIQSEYSIYGKVAQIASEYELYFQGKDSSQTRYGVNLLQLIQTDGKWLITSMCWDDDVKLGQISLAAN